MGFASLPYTLWPNYCVVLYKLEIFIDSCSFVPFYKKNLLRNSGRILVVFYSYKTWLLSRAFNKAKYDEKYDNQICGLFNVCPFRVYELQ